MLGLLAAALVGVVFSGPGGAWKAALKDISDPTQVTRDDRPYTRYLSLDNIPEDQRETTYHAVCRAVNCLSINPAITRPVLVEGGQVIRLDERDYGWDAVSRDDRIKFLEGRGVKFQFKDDREKQLFRFIWEKAADRDRYFVGARQKVTKKVDVSYVKTVRNQTYRDPYGRHYTRSVYVTVPQEKVEEYRVDIRGWIDPVDFDQAYKLSNSYKFILRADFFLDITGYDRKNAAVNPKAIVDGLYSDFLVLPKTEADLYKTIGVDEAFIGGGRFATGGAVVDSGVAKHNRGLELLGLSGSGRGANFLWRTYDFFDSLETRDVRANYVGDDGFSTLKADGGELIWTLPNGLHGYWAINGNGDQVGEVPTGIAERPGAPDSIVYPWTCVKCHDQGIIPFKDVQKPFATDIPDTYLAGLSTHIDKARLRQKLVETYHLPGHTQVFGPQQQAYLAAVREATGLKGDDKEVAEKHAADYISVIETYRYTSLTPEVAAREMGVPLEDARAAWKKSGDPDLLGLWLGQTVKRDSWEDSFGNAMLNRPPYPWEKRP